MAMAGERVHGTKQQVVAIGAVVLLLVGASIGYLSHSPGQPDEQPQKLQEMMSSFQEMQKTLARVSVSTETVSKRQETMEGLLSSSYKSTSAPGTVQQPEVLLQPPPPPPPSPPQPMHQASWLKFCMKRIRQGTCRFSPTQASAHSCHRSGSCTICTDRICECGHVPGCQTLSCSAPST